MADQKLVHEIPSSLKQLARFLARGFYTIEDALIVDMLVRNPCKFDSAFVFPAKKSILTDNSNDLWIKSILICRYERWWHLWFIEFRS